MAKLLAMCTTVGEAADARRLADAAVERRLAACVHVETIASVYRWQGAVQHDNEHRLTFKTSEAAAPALRALLLELHPYELPALWTLELADASDAYRDWVLRETSG